MKLKKRTRAIRTRIRRFFSGVPLSLVLTSILLPLGGLLIGLVIGPVASPENTRFLLSGLVGAQSGILAIVFSVTVIGIQLIGARYSPRMLSLFTDSPVFRYTFGLFVFSIGLDLWLLYTVPDPSTAFHTAGVFATSGLGVAVAFALLVFVQTAVRQSTPEGAIDAFVSSMSTDRYLAQVRESVEDSSENAHPMRPLYTMVMNALSSGERVTAERALQEYGELSTTTLSRLKEREIFSKKDRQIGKTLFEPVLKEHLPDISLHAEEQNENQIVSDATEWQYKIGKAGLDLPTDRVSNQAQYGLSNVIRKAPVDSGSLVASGNAWDQLGDLLVDASEKPNPKVVWNISSSIRRNIRQQVWQVSDIHWYQNSMMRLYSNMEDAHEALLGYYGDDVASVDMEWQYEHVPDDAPNYDEVAAVHRWRRTLLDTTASFLRYIAEEDEYPITEGNFKDNWKNFCIEASNSPAEDYAIVLCQALIEIAFVDKCELGETGIPWAFSISRVKHEGDPEIVDAAFDRILEYEYVEEEPDPPVAGEMEERYETYYRNILSVQDYRPLNTIAGFEEIVKEIQDQADERWERLEHE